MKHILHFVLATVVITSLFVNADPLTNTLWSDHQQSDTLRINFAITNNSHFMWSESPVPPRNLVAVVLDGKRSNGTLLSDSAGVYYRDPVDMVREYVRDFFVDSHGHIRYEVLDLVVTTNVPMRRLGATEGYVYTNFSIDAFYDRCPDNPDNGPLTVDNDGSTMDALCITNMLKTIMLHSGVSLFEAATNGTVHEILFFGPHKAYQWEDTMCGAYPLWINGATVTIPNSPHFAIIGCNTARGVAEMIHNNFHRWENVAPNMYANLKSVGWQYEWSYSWHGATPPFPYTELERQELFGTQYDGWEQFTVLHYAINTNINTIGNAMSGIGDCHYPVNVEPKKDLAYDYSDGTTCNSSYKYFRNPVLKLTAADAIDPTKGPTSSGVNSSTWYTEYPFASTDYQRSYINWAFSAIPHGKGKHLNKKAIYKNETPTMLLNNWWGYFGAHEQYLEPIRALRRNGMSTNYFPEPLWSHSTYTFMTNKWDELGYDTTEYAVSVNITGSGSVSGDGNYVWGSGAMLESTPAAYMWIHGSTTNYNSDQFPVVVLSNTTVHVIFQSVPNITITNPVISDVASGSTYTISGTNNAYATAGVWSNLTSGTGGTITLNGAWSIPNVALAYGNNEICVYASNQWFSVSDAVMVYRVPDMFVSATGNDANSGFSWLEAKKTLKSARDAAYPNTTIYVGTGTFSGTDNVGLSWYGKDGINVVGISPTATIFQITGSQSFITDCAGLKNPTLFANLKVDGSSLWQAFDGRGAFYFGDSTKLNVTISNCWLQGPYDGDQVNSTSGTIDQRNCSGVELNWYGTSAAYTGMVSMIHCLIESWGRAIYIDDDAGSSCYTAKFDQCTFVNNSDTTTGGERDTIVVRNNASPGRFLLFNRCVMSHTSSDPSSIQKSGIFYAPDAPAAANRVLCFDNLFHAASIGANGGVVYSGDSACFYNEENDINDVEPTYITYDGKPYSMEIPASDTKRGWSVHLTAGMPYITITNPPTDTISVPSTTTTYTVAGTNAFAVAYAIWSNVTTTATGDFTADTADGNWQISSISLNIGTNLIVVHTTNSYGNSGTDSVEIYRTPITPSVTITNPASNINVSGVTAAYTLSGTNSTTFDSASWSNLTAGTGGDLTADCADGNWTIDDLQLASGANTIEVYIKNSTIEIKDTVVITRPTTLYVATTGDDANAGDSWGNAKLTLKGARDAAADGTYIFVGEGTFSGANNVYLSWSGKDGVHVIGRSPTSTVFQITSNDRFITDIAGLTENTLFANLKVDGTGLNQSAFDGVGAFYAQNVPQLNFTISNCWLVGPYDGDQLNGVDGTADTLNCAGVELNWYGDAQYKGQVEIYHTLFERWGRAFYADDDNGHLSTYTTKFVNCTFINNADTRNNGYGDRATVFIRGATTGRWVFMEKCVMSHTAMDSLNANSYGIYYNPVYLSALGNGVTCNDNLFYTNSIGNGANNTYAPAINRYTGEESNIVLQEPMYDTINQKDYTLIIPVGATHRGWSVYETTEIPEITITNPASDPLTVSFATSSYPLAGTNNTYVTSAYWTNMVTGASGSLTADCADGNWSDSVPLAYGDNVIYVYANGTYASDADSVTIHREIFVPNITITIPSENILVDAATYDIAGTNNAYVSWAGWSNITTGATGDLTSDCADGNWSVSSVSLNTGANEIYVYASNTMASSQHNVTIFRMIEKYVSTSGDNANSGDSWVNAKLTIQGALDTVTQGANIYVSSGTFSGVGNVNLNWVNKDAVNLIGAGPDKTTFVVTGGDKCIEGLENKTVPTLFTGFKIDGTGRNTSWDNNGLMHVGTTAPQTLNIIISNVWFVGPYDGDQINGIAGTPNCRNAKGIYLTGYGSSAYYKGNIRVTHCLFERLGIAYAPNDDYNNNSVYTTRFEYCTFVNNNDTSTGTSETSPLTFRGNNVNRWYFIYRCVMSHCAQDNAAANKYGIHYQANTVPPVRVFVDDNLFYTNTIGKGSNNTYGDLVTHYSGVENDIVTQAPMYVTLDGKDYSEVVGPTETYRGWSVAVDTNPPVVYTDVLLYPVHDTIVTQGIPTNVYWDASAIIDNYFNTNCWILKMDVCRSNDTSQVLQTINPPTPNPVGQHVWTPAAPVGNEYPNMFVMNVYVEDDYGNTTNRVIWEQPFYIVPEPCGIGAIVLLSCFIGILCRQKN